MKRLLLVILIVCGLSARLAAQDVSTAALGGLAQSQTASCLFHTFRQDTGASATLAGTPAVKVYKDVDNSSEVTTGLTLTADFDSVTGLNAVAIDTSNAFYAVGHDYTVVITAGTVNSVSVVGAVACRFSIANRATDLGFIGHSTTNVSVLATNVDAIKTQVTSLTIKKNTAFTAFPVTLYDSNGDPKTGLTVTCTVSLDGGAFAACANSVSEVSGGLYKINLGTADTNGNSVVLKFTATGAKTSLIPIITQP